LYNNNNEDAFRLFLNRVDVPGFEDETILDTVLLWNNNATFVCALHNMGAVSHIKYTNIIQRIHRMEWINPFEPIVMIEGFPQFHHNALLDNQNIGNNIANYADYYHFVARRHIAHFEDNMQGLFAILDYEEQVNEDYNDMMRQLEHYEHPHDIMFE
jgi:hypothetical protein